MSTLDSYLYSLPKPAESGQQETLNPVQDYSGSGPGLDLGDITAGAATAIDYGLKALDSLGRPVRTALHTGDLGKAWDAIWDPSKAASTEDLLKDVGYQNYGTREGFGPRNPSSLLDYLDPTQYDLGDIVDFGANMAVGMATDPLAYATFGQTAAGHRAAQAGEELISSGIRRSGLVGAADRAAALERFNQATGKALTEIKPGFTGLEDGFVRQVMAGEQGMHLGIPLLKPHMQEIPLPKALRPVMAGVVDPISSTLGVAGDLVKMTKPGRYIADQLGSIGEAIRNPELWTAEGRMQKSLEDQSRELVVNMTNQVAEAWKKAKAAGLSEQDERAVGDLVQVVYRDPQTREFRPRGEGATLRKEAGAETLVDKHKRLTQYFQAMTPEKRGAAYEYLSFIHDLAEQDIKKRMDLGLPFARIEDYPQGKLQEIEDQLAGVTKEINEKMRGGSAPPPASGGVPPQPSPAPKIPPAAGDARVSAPPAEGRASVTATAPAPAPIDRTQRDGLLNLGYSPAEIDALSPQEAYRLWNEGVPKNAAAQSAVRSVADVQGEQSAVKESLTPDQAINKSLYSEAEQALDRMPTPQMPYELREGLYRLGYNSDDMAKMSMADAGRIWDEGIYKEVPSTGVPELSPRVDNVTENPAAPAPVAEPSTRLRELGWAGDKQAGLKPENLEWLEKNDILARRFDAWVAKRTEKNPKFASKSLDAQIEALQTLRYNKPERFEKLFVQTKKSPKAIKAPEAKNKRGVLYGEEMGDYSDNMFGGANLSKLPESVQIEVAEVTKEIAQYTRGGRGSVEDIMDAIANKRLPPELMERLDNIKRIINDTPDVDLSDVDLSLGGSANRIVPDFNEYMAQATPLERETLGRHEQTILDVAESLGMPVRFYSDIPARGLYQRSTGMIGLRAGMPPAELAHVFGHEFTHRAFASLSKTSGRTLLESAKAVLGADYDRLMGEITERYAQAGKMLTPDKALEEILVDAGGKLFKDDGLAWIMKAAEIEPSIVDQIVDAILAIKTQIESIIYRTPPEARESLEIMARKLQETEVRFLKLKKNQIQGNFSRAETGVAASVDASLLPKTGPPSPELQALLDKKAALEQEAELWRQRVKETPGYLPSTMTQEEAERIIREGGAATGRGGVKTREAGRYQDGKLEGVPMVREEFEAKVRAGGTGTKATQGKDMRRDISVWEAIKGFFNGKEGLERAKKLAGENAAFTEANPAKAWARHIASDFRNTLTNVQMKRDVVNTYASVGKQEWEGLLKAVQDKNVGSLADLEALFFKQTKRKLSDMLAPEVYDSLKAGRSKLEDVFKPSAVPFGWRELHDVYDGKQFKTFYVPQMAYESFERMERLTKNRMVQFLRDNVPSLMGYMSLWRRLQTAYWPKFHVRNQIGDLVRMYQTGSYDGQTPGDFAKLYQALPNMDLSALGKGDYSFLGGTQFQVGKHAQALGGTADGMISGDQLMAFAAKNGLVNAGIVGTEFIEQLERQMTGSSDGLLNKLANKGGATHDKAMRLLGFREDANRLAALAARLRAGDSPMSAVLRVEETLYNQARISPAAQFLRATGIAPFAGWSAKNIPAQIEWALTNPGQFAATLRAIEMIQNDEISEDALPKYMKDKFNVVLRKGKDGQGRAVWEVATASGFMPFTDLTDMIAEMRKTGLPTKTLGSLLEGPFKVAYDEWKDGKKTAGQIIVRNFVGKPGVFLGKLADVGQINPHTGELSKSLGEVITDEFRPVSSVKIQVEKSVEAANSRIKSELGRAKSKLRELTAMRNQAATLNPGADSGTFTELDQELQAQAALVYRLESEARSALEKNQRTLEKARARLAAP